jgi:hypothetical protein
LGSRRAFVWRHGIGLSEGNREKSKRERIVKTDDDESGAALMLKHRR